MKIFILVANGCVESVYSDTNGVEVEVIDLDGQHTYEDSLLAQQRADEVEAEFVRVDL